MKKYILITLILISVTFIGCSEKITTDALAGEWKLIGVELEETDIQNDIMAGNIEIRLTVTDKEMIFHANDYSDPPMTYNIVGNKIVMDEKTVITTYKNGKLTLDIIHDDHLHSFLFDKLN